MIEPYDPIVETKKLTDRLQKALDEYANEMTENTPDEAAIQATISTACTFLLARRVLEYAHMFNGVEQSKSNEISIAERLSLVVRSLQAGYGFTGE